MEVSTASSTLGTQLITDVLNGYVSGLDTKADLQNDLSKVEDVLNNDKDH